jgi:thymidine kinase
MESKEGDKKKRHGQLHMILGPMFAEKTTELLRRCKRCELGGLHVFFATHADDNRFGMGETKVQTHSGLHRTSFKLKSISEFEKHLKSGEEEKTVLFIDEVQFFDPLLTVKTTEDFLSRGIEVVVAGLNGDSNRKPWETISRLIPLASNITFLSAVCQDCPFGCRSEASFSKLLLKKQEEESQIVLIGGADKYKSVCGFCLFIV